MGIAIANRKNHCDFGALEVFLDVFHQKKTKEKKIRANTSETCMLDGFRNPSMNYRTTEDILKMGISKFRGVGVGVRTWR